MPIGVMGCNIDLPDSFPVDFRDNAGNMVHANAPFGMFGDCFHSTKTPRFPDFVNECCSHLIITMANAVRLGEGPHDRYKGLLRLLDYVKKPVVVFGLGAQAESENRITDGLPQATIDLIKILDEKATVIGVRGFFTKKVLEECAGAKKVFVTGCPSLFSRRDLVRTLRLHASTAESKPAFAGTNFYKMTERSLLKHAIAGDTYYVEPFNKDMHLFHERLNEEVIVEKEFPHFVRKLRKEYKVDVKAIEDYFRDRYKIFRCLRSWLSFSANNVSFTYGTRFHVNMASLLSGRPAMWITHDTRTNELVSYFKLPHMSQEEASNLKTEEIGARIDLNPFFDNYGHVASRFNEFLKIAGLPKLEFIT